MRDEDAVFIVGVPRSGTSVLRNNIEQLDSFAPKRLHSDETKIFSHPRAPERILEDLPMSRRLLEYFLGEREIAGELVQDLTSLAAQHRSFPTAILPKGLRKLWSSRGGQTLLWRADGHHHRARLFFHHARRAREARRIIEKTPNHAVHLDEMHITFPRLRVLMCVRHPVDAYSSYRKRLSRERKRGVPSEENKWLEISPGRFARKYSRWIEHMTRFSRRQPHAALWVRYEELTRDPAAVMTGIYRHLDESPPPQAVIDDDESVRRDRYGSPHKTTRIVENHKNWQDFVSEAEARKIENRLAACMNQLDYPRHTSPDLAHQPNA